MTMHSCKFSRLCSPARSYLRYSLLRGTVENFRFSATPTNSVRVRPLHAYSAPVRNSTRRNIVQNHIRDRRSAILTSCNYAGSPLLNCSSARAFPSSRYFSTQAGSIGGSSGDSGAPAGGESAGGSGGDDGNYQEPPIPEAPETVSVSLTPVTVPEYFPIVPVIAVKRNPLFPRFVKLVEVRV